MIVLRSMRARSTRPATRRAVVACVLLAAACSKPAPPVAEQAVQSGVPADVQPLSDELFELVDRAADYRASHQNRPPRDLREMGLDSLTPTLVRRLDTPDSLGFTVRYRRGGDEVSACSAGAEILEQASLHEGRFAVSCDTPAGLTTFEVTRSP